MNIHPDFKGLLELFNKNLVSYVIVGAYALAQYGVPRYTGDLDILVEPEPDNADRIINALNEFGFGSLELTAEDFYRADTVVQLGVPPVRVDVLTGITGVSWQEIWKGKQSGNYGDLEVYYLGKVQFIKNKRALGRKKDLADLEALGEDG